MKRVISTLIAVILGVVIWMPVITWAQVNSGSTGSDGALNPTATNTVINMADHPTGIYNYISVNIPSYVTVTFVPDSSNTPVVWLVQSNVVISGAVSLSGQQAPATQGGSGGPGGYAGGNGANGNSQATSGQGPGGGSTNSGYGSYNYGNQYLIPLLGGSGGGGSPGPPGGCGINGGGGGGGGAILIASSKSITVSGGISAAGGAGTTYCGGGYGSGGAIRLVASQILGNGGLNVNGGGAGRIRLDTYDNEFTGSVAGNFSQGSQFVIIPTAGQGAQLSVVSVGGVAVSASPTGAVATPDAVLSAQQNNPVPIVVQCTNIPLNTPITVSVTPMNGSPVSGVGYNNIGTLASSTATISIVMPRGGGLIYATAATSN